MSNDGAAARAEGVAAPRGHGIAFGTALRVWLRIGLLSFGGPARENAEPLLAGELEASKPDRRLPDSGSAFEHERALAVGRSLEEAAHDVQLGVPPGGGENQHPPVDLVPNGDTHEVSRVMRAELSPS